MRDYVLVTDEKFGYKRLSPVPTEKELEEFYGKHYATLIQKGNKAPHIKKLMDVKERKAELNWFNLTVFSDILSVLKEHLGRRNDLFEIGCGAGDFLDYASKNGWHTKGIEPSEELAAIASKKGITGLNITNCTLDGYLKGYRLEKFDAIVIMNILEHVADPLTFISDAKKLLKDDGMMVIKVPNDFNELQKICVENGTTADYWVSAPDHINYFNIDSLTKFLLYSGFKIKYKMTDFPMEFFLLMGEDFIKNPKLGSLCHKKRVNFELQLPADYRRRMYAKFAEVGIGRSIVCFLTL
ncbi:MAG: class I SAM-dependent methyltransferase [archaeon]|nr:class I SAM-dependent methyltransferase [Candidatus Micrarchaeota archaeon]